MLQFNIFWKGCPHRHLPSIRVASPHYGSTASRQYAHIAALEVCRLPYSLAFKKARLRERTRIRRSKQRSRGTLGGIITPKRIPQRAMSNLWLSGLKSPRLDLLSSGEGNGELGALLFTNRLSTSPLRLSGDLVDSIDSFSNPTLVKDGRNDTIYPIHATEPAEIVDLKLKGEKNGQRSQSNRRVGGKHDQAVSTSIVRKTSIRGRFPVLGRSRTYDPRLLVRRARQHTESTSSKNDAIGQSRGMSILLKPATMDKQRISTNPPMRQVRRSTSSTESSSEPIQLSCLPSRTPTQLAASKNFRRGLERHLIAQEAVRKACLSLSSPSSSTLSVNTVVEFVPYLAEFQAAGLVITSTEQRAPVVRHSGRGDVPLPSKNVGSKEENPANAREGMGKENPVASHAESADGLYNDDTSSRAILTAFSSCGEPNSIVTYPTRNKSTKRTLPWLHKAEEPSSLSQSILTDRMTVINDMRSSSTSTCETCATTIIDFSPQPISSEARQNVLSKWAYGGFLEMFS
jgi:hypothetical protein